MAQAIEPAKLSTSIPAQPLGEALSVFARQTGLQLIYVSEVLGSQSSHGASAGADVKDALKQLLQGTGLQFEFLTAHSVRILAAPRTMPRPVINDEAPREVIVTATRRQENLQDVPITVQTINGEQLKQLGVTTFSDLLQYAPNVTFNGNGPATGNIFIRGLGAAGTGNQEQPTTGLFPNVAFYLDDQPMQFPSRNNDVYTIDLQRIEILEGPQGTLFGGGAQGGAIIYITNRPNLDATSAEVHAAYGTTAGGDPNSSLNATLNLPIIADKVAIRAVAFSENQAGYMSNVPGTISYLPGSIAATTGVKASNPALVASDTNPVRYEGARVTVLWKLDEDWNILLQQNYQDMESAGSFYAEPLGSNGVALQPYQQTDFTPSFSKDRYESTAWTLHGLLGPISALYTGSFMVRHIEAQQDYSNYARSELAASYGCIGPGAGYFNDKRFSAPAPAGLAGTKLTCYPPVGSWHDTIENQHQSHELRITTDPQSRLRGIAGAFWEKFVIFDQMDFNYLSIPQCDPANLTTALAGGAACLSAVGPIPGVFANDPGLRNDVAFGNDDQRGYQQFAFFGSVDFDLIPKVLTLTAGTRHYKYDEFESGSEFYTASSTSLILNHANGACTRAGLCGYPIDLSKSESGFVNRANLTWHITPDVMAYYTYSQGFRPSGFNRTPSVSNTTYLPYRRAPYCGSASTDPRCLPGGSLSDVNTDQYLTPVSYNSDNLINNEIGAKSELLDHRLIVNASAYWMNWNHVQSTLADAVNLGNSVFGTNGPSYTVKGLELQLSARLGEGLTVQGSGSWNRSRQTDTPCLISAGQTVDTPDNPTPAGQCITIIAGHPYTNPWGELGSSLPYAPSLQFNVRARYEWQAADFRPFFMANISHTGATRNAPENYPDGDSPGENPPKTTLLLYAIPGYNNLGASFGLTKDNWTAQLTGSNLTNAYGPSNITSAEFIKAEVPLRPRVLMLGFSYRL